MNRIKKQIPYFFLINLFLFANFFAFCQKETFSISGVITGADSHAPLINANVYIHELKLWAATNKKGQYSFTSLPKGTFTIEISYIGYKPFIGNVVVNGSAIWDAALEHTIVENDNVTVTGVAAATSLRHAPLHISVITKNQLQQNSGTNLLDAIAKQPGVSIVTTGPAIAKPFIRGLGYNRVVTINDGIRQEGQQWGDEHGVEIDEYSAQKVEILRGPASLMYGSDAIGGVLNILTNIPIPDKTVRANLSGSMNSNDKMYGGFANISGNNNGLNWNAYGSLKNAADYNNRYDGNVLNSRFNEKNFGGYIGLNKYWGFSHLIFSKFDQNVGMIEGDRDNAGSFILNGYNKNELANGRNPLVPYQWVRHTKLVLDNSFSLKNGNRITAIIAGQRNQRQEFSNVKLPTDPNAYFDLKTLNYNAAYHFSLLNGWKTSLGINGMKQSNRNRAAEALIPDYNLFDIGAYLYASKLIHKTNISGGARFDNRSIDGKATAEDGAIKFQPFQKTYSNISASLGLSTELNEHVSLKANVSKGFRAPNVPELSANGKHEGTNRYEIGNTGLKSEASFSADGSLEVNTLHISLNISPFFNHINNFIYLEKLLGGNGADSLINNTPAFRYAQQSANMYGIEANFDIHPHPLDWLHFENTFSYVRGKFTHAVDGSQNLPLVAPARLLTELRAEFPNQIKTFKNFYAKFEVDNVAAQNNFFAGFNTETATQVYTLLNAGIGSDIEIAGKKYATIIFNVNNITNKAYQSHLSRLKYFAENPATGRTGVFNMGRNISVRLIVPMEWKLK